VARPEPPPAVPSAEPDVGLETLPPDLRAKFEAARQELRGERREVVVLFADVSGYTAMSERLDPEEVSLMMQGLMRELADAVYRYEGYVDKYIGDAIMALFGAPVSHEDDPERALLAALDMLQVTARHRDRGSEIHLRVGLNIGDVVAAHMGSEMRLQYTVMGDAVNVASRLEGKAEPDTILISHALYERVSTVFETVEVPPVTVKGKAEPLRVHRVVRYRPAPVDGDRIRTPFVGREPELAELEAYLRLVESADVPPLLIEAEAGAGKSRLLREALARTRTPFTRVEVEFSPIQLPGKLAVAGTLFRELTAAEGGDPIAEARHLLAELGAEADEHRAGVEGLLVSIGAIDRGEGEADPSADPKVERQKRWLALSSLLRRSARDRPVLVILEDIHFTAEADDEFLEFLVPVLRGHRLGVIATGRPGSARPWLPEDAKTLSLHQLDGEEIRSFMGGLFEGLRPSVRRELLRRSQGNPLYLEELMRSMQEKMETVVTSVPGTLQGLLQSRIDSLPGPLQLLLQMAAVLGSEFPVELLSRMYRLDVQDIEFEQALRSLLEGGFVEVEDAAQKYRFRHALMQEVAYARLLVRLRKVLHESAARLGEDVYADRLEAEAPFFAHHYWEADLRTDAAPHLWAAARRTAAEYELQKAEGYFERLASVLESEPSVMEDPEDRAGMADAYGYVLFDRGHLDQAERWFATLGELGERHSREEWTVRSLWYRGLNAINRGQLDQAEALFDAGLNLLTAPEGRLKADLHSGQGLVSYDRGHLEGALDHHQEALRLRQDADDKLGMAKSLMNLGNVYSDLLHDDARAEEHYESALQYAEEAGDRLMRGGVTLNLGGLAMDRGEWARALRRFERVNTLADEMGWSFLSFLSLRNQVECYVYLGQVDRALAAIQACHEQGEDVLIPMNRVATRLLAFEAYTTALDDDRAAEALESARETARRLEVHAWDDWIHLCEGWRLEIAGRLEEAAPEFEEALRIAATVEHGAIEKRARAHHRRVRVKAGGDDPHPTLRESDEHPPTAALLAYLEADLRALGEPSDEVADELGKIGEIAAGLEWAALERAAFERRGEVLAQLGRVDECAAALQRSAGAMRRIAGWLPAELRAGYLAHPRNAALRGVEVETIPSAMPIPAADAPGEPVAAG
jgi:class 3 adenylate cyclase/tetratricopeptide (TPR) repeat protein